MTLEQQNNLKGISATIASIIIQVCLGGIYAWSVFIRPLKMEFNITEGRAGIVFGCTVAIFTLSMILAGNLLKSYSPRIISAISGILYGVGYLMAWHSSGRYWIILSGIGIVSAIGIGFGYVCGLTTPVKWFPRRKGFITGLSVAGFGGGAILLTSVANSLIKNNVSVLTIFHYQGMIYGAAILVASIFMFVPEAKSKAVLQRIEWGKILPDPRFKLLSLGMFAGTFAGLLVISNLKSIALSYGISINNAALAVSMFAIGNSAGRIVWGWLFDKITKGSIPASLGMMWLGILLLIFPRSPQFYCLVSLYVGFCFGANFVVYASQTAVWYGEANLARIYPLVFIFYGISGIASAPIAGFIYQHMNNYLPSFILSLFLLMVAIAFSLKHKEQ